MEAMNWIPSADQAAALAKQPPAMSFALKREVFDRLGLGMGLADDRIATIDLGGGAKRMELVSTSLDLSKPEQIETTWREARPTIAEF